MTLSQRLPRSFYNELHTRLRHKLERTGMDALLVDDWRDVAYLTGFFHHPNERPAAVWISTDQVVLMVPELEREHAYAQGAAVDDVVAFTEFPGLESPFQVLARTVGTTGRWGHSPTLSTGRFAELQHVFEGVIWALSGIVDDLRLVKQPEEVTLHRAAAELGDIMLTAGRDLIQATVTEGDPFPTESQLADHVVREGTRWMYTTHEDVVVVPMLTGGLVYAGENTAFPHGLPSKTRLKAGDTVILSLGGAAGGRYAESERTFFLGDPTADQLRYFETDHRAQEIGTQAIRPGAVCRDVNRQCLDVIREAGLDEYIRHRQGHGIGLNNHEAPWLEDGDTTELMPGMILSSEPGIYVPGHAGYRISDTVLVTDDGRERLTTYPRDLDDIVITL